ncbi:uncharacterized protein CPUR_02884 [Claviceps purpurea 20.1]|uniref:Protein kinase domain-containing protein n=1 Tax=Claviceps purpurea (strain 20.1) TaxID=1111077 RepID=M1VVA7_CLAP2|nr:uncharacterized protein CPUR_02884 [Claviceps purpurea 20.1]
MALVLNQENESIFLRQRIQDLERQIQERDRESQQEGDRALQRERERTLQVVKEGDGILQQFQETEERERQIQEAERQNRKRKRRDEKRQRRDQQGERQAEKKKKMLQQERDKTLEQAQEGEGAVQQERDRALQQAKERERSLQQERDRALQQAEARDRQYQELAKVLQQAYERERQVKEIAKALEDVHEKRRQFQEMATAVLQEQAIASALQKAKERERQAEKRETALQQERDKALQQAQNGERQALETARELREERLRASQLERERDSALQLVQKKDLALQASTLDEYVKECHGSLFSKLIIHPEAQHGRDATTADVRGKWQPRKVMEWTGFLSEQRLIFDHVCDVFTPAVRPLPRLITVKENGNKIAPITDEKSMARFISDSIEEPVKHIMRELQSVDKLGRICQRDVRIDFINHTEHKKPFETETTSLQPGKPVHTKFCICRDPEVEMSMASSTMLYAWESKAPYDLTIENLRAALQPTTAFGEVTEELESPAVQDAEEALQSTATAEKRAKCAVTQTYHNMMESCLEFGILTTGQAIVFLHVNWDDPQTLYYYIAEPALDVAKGPERDAAFLSAVGQYVAFTIMALTKSRLVRGGSLDLKCPNVMHHCRSDAGEAGAGHPNRHPVDHTEWLRLLQDQFKQSLDEGITYQSVVGARGALFKVTLLAYGYTFVSKGTVSGYIKHLEHEARVYEQLKPIQGQYVPVFLGAMDLRTMDKDYWISYETYVVHMMFMSWGGFRLESNKMAQLGVLRELAWVDEGIASLHAVHKQGVLHCDVRWANILYSPHTHGIMLIDFERAELFNAPGSSEEDSHTKAIMAMTEEQRQTWANIVYRANAEQDDIVSIILDALGIED